MKNGYLPIVLTATAFGLVAGMAGAIFTNVYSASERGSLAFNRELNLSNYGYLSPNLVIRDPKKVVVNQDVKTDETVRSLQSSLLTVFLKDSNVNKYYDFKNPFALALAATTDGWVMSLWPQSPSRQELAKAAAEYIVIDSNRKLYQVDLIVVAPEEMGDFVFMHLRSASGLNVRRLVPDAEIKTGQSLLLAAADNSFALNALSSKAPTNSLASSDVYSQSLRLAYASESKSAFVFNLSGEIIGAIDRQGKWLASPELDAYWRSLLKSKTLAWPMFGVNYLNLSLVAGHPTWAEKGAILQDGETGSAVVKGGAAEKAGLKAGDIITRINGVEINADNDLAVLLSAYNPGDSVNVNYLRNGNSAQTEVVLGGK